MEAILLNTVTAGYSQEHPIFKDLNLEIEGGSVIGLLGPNGTGKTTFVKLLVGLLPSWQGEIRVLGSDPYRNAKIRSEIGIMHQSPGFEEMLTGWDNLRIAGRFFNLTFREVHSRVHEIEEALGPFDYFKQPVISLSGGQKRRLQVVRALLNRPSLLILDEPTVALDVQGRQRFYALIQSLSASQPLTIFWTTHYLEEVERNCDRVVVLSDGKIVASETTVALKQSRPKGKIVVKFDPTDMTKIPEKFREQQGLHSVATAELEFMGGDESTFYRSVLPCLLSFGAIPNSISRREPSLEEIYLDLTKLEAKDV